MGSIAILECDLGDVASFDPDIFPRAYYECEGNLNKGCVLIEATLDEMKAIKKLGIDLNKNEDFIFDTRVELQASVNSFTAHTRLLIFGSLNAKKAELQDKRKTLNPFKVLLNYRAVRLFHAASKTLYRQTRVWPHKLLIYSIC